MGDPLILRLEAIPSDTLEQLVDLLVAVVDDGASVGFLPPLGRDEARRYWEAVPRSDVVLLVATGEGQVVGTGQLHLETRANGRHRAEVAKVLVHPAARRRGIARALMSHLEAIARDKGRTLLVLDTRAGDPSNLLYRALGYREAGRIPGYAGNGSGGFDPTVIYYKDLSRGSS